MIGQTSYTANPEDFLPINRLHQDTLNGESLHGLTARSSQSYWQGVWQRLRAKPRAMVSLFIIVLLLLFTTIGPLLWQVNPSEQALGRASITSQMSRQALLVVENDGVITQNDGFNKGQERVRVLEAHTEWVRLQWQPKNHAERYVIYRHIQPPRHRYDLGLPVGETRLATQTFYEDRLGLRPQTYYYSIVPVINAIEVEPFDALIVTPQLAISQLDAQLQQLISTTTAIESLPHKVTLPAHPLGTDALGRDMLARLMVGARTSLFIGFFAPLLFVSIGVFYGAIAGYVGGRVDNVMMRFADFVIALPFLLFMILLKVAFGIGPGESGILPMLVAMVILSWPSSARLVRGQVMQLREQPYVEAARLMGASSRYLIIRHMLPNVLGVVLVSLSFAIPSAIFTEAFLSFIGMGVVPPTPSWGSMSNDGMKTLLSHPHELLLPSLLICLTVLAFNLLGDALRDALDAKLEP